MTLQEAIRQGRDRYIARMEFVVTVRAFLYRRKYQGLMWHQAVIMAEMELRYGTTRRNVLRTESEGSIGRLSLQATAQNGVYNGCLP